MRWGTRKQHAAQNAQCVQEDEGERGSKGKGRAFSFSPLSWLAKLTAKEKPGAAAKHAAAFPPKNSAAAPAFPSCFPKRTSPSPVVVTPGRPSPPRRSPAATDVVPRRLSVGNDNADAVAARRHSQHRRRHCSLGGDRELPPLGHLIPFSLAGSPARQPRTAPATAAPDTDAGAAQVRRHRRRRSSRRLSSSGRRSSFYRRMPPRVRVRSPRGVAPELERLAVVRRTRDPQRAFRESMVEMIASTTGSGGAPQSEELERLLACYLSLNADEHHDCIVKVFRQVLFEYINLQLPRPGASGRRPLGRR
ncbi:transcription repressor OFP1-like [Phragmites australis]|uniref:transcription repressor OFP1-like n=1 Tax=Phragmites australis TaxID=29695 RepID=UPI002D77BA35|nr:transcription repressor OFP1-like [Phragmites australis]